MATPSTRQSTPRKPTVGSAVLISGFYYVLILMVWPVLTDFFPPGSLILRFPLVVGIWMLLVAIYFGRPLKQIRLSAQLFAFFAVFYLASSLFGPAAPGLMEGITMLFRSVGIGVALVLAIRSTRDLNFFLNLSIWAGVISACYGLLFMVPGLTPIGEMLHAMGMQKGRDLVAFRMVGLQSDPTYFGLSVLPGFLICLNDLLRQRGRVDWRAAGLAVLLFLSILLSFSRSTWGGLVIGILVLTGMTRNLVRAIFFFLVFMFALQFTAMDDFLASAISENSARTSFNLDQQADSRTWIWQAYLQLAISSPTGYGMGSIETLRQFATWSRDREGSTARPHNIYLIIWVESGLQTLIPFLLLIGLSLRRSWSLRGYADPVTGREYGTLTFAMTLSMTVGLFALGGMIQLLAINVAIGLAAWYLKTENRLLPVAPPGRAAGR